MEADATVRAQEHQALTGHSYGLLQEALVGKGILECGMDNKSCMVLRK